jgi:hypothetical protein
MMSGTNIATEKYMAEPMDRVEDRACRNRVYPGSEQAVVRRE